jgi:hypothetical protein
MRKDFDIIRVHLKVRTGEISPRMLVYGRKIDSLPFLGGKPKRKK